MSDTVTMTEEELEERLEHTNVAGKHTAYAHCVNLLITKSGELFAHDQDAQARLVRDLAKELKVFQDSQFTQLQGHITQAMKRAKK